MELRFLRQPWYLGILDKNQGDQLIRDDNLSEMIAV